MLNEVEIVYSKTTKAQYKSTEDKGFNVKDLLKTSSEIGLSISNKDVYDQNEITGIIPYSPIMRAYLNENNNEISKDFVSRHI